VGHPPSEGPNYVGNNVTESSANKVNSDLPGGQPEAANKFNELTKGQGSQINPQTGQRIADDGTRLRNNNDGTANIDRPASVTGRKHEDIHFNTPN